MKKALLTAMILALAAGPSWAKPAVAVSVVPQRYFVKEIAGDLVDVTVVIPPGASPVTYEPKPSQMADLSRCSLWFTVGVPFERAEKDRILSALPNLKEVKTYGGLKLAAMDGRCGAAKETAMDPHVWLSPSMAVLQARTMALALAELDEKNREFYMDGYVRFAGKSASLDASLARILAPVRGRAFMVFHPSWGYFARDYGLVQMAAEIEGKEPKPRDLAEIADLSRSLGIDTVFVQPQFSRAAAEVLAKSIGGRAVPLDPMAPDWEDNLRRAALALAEASR